MISYFSGRNSEADGNDDIPFIEVTSRRNHSTGLPFVFKPTHAGFSFCKVNLNILAAAVYSAAHTKRITPSSVTYPTLERGCHQNDAPAPDAPDAPDAPTATNRKYGRSDILRGIIHAVDWKLSFANICKFSEGFISSSFRCSEGNYSGRSQCHQLSRGTVPSCNIAPVCVCRT